MKRGKSLQRNPLHATEALHMTRCDKENEDYRTEYRDSGYGTAAGRHWCAIDDFRLGHPLARSCLS